jgi:hypothetical protein
MVSIKTKLELCSECDPDPEETGARSWDAQSRNRKGVLCDEVKPDAGEVKKATERSKRRRVRLRLCTYQRVDFDAPFTKSFNLVTSNDKSVIENEGRSAANPPW